MTYSIAQRLSAEAIGTGLLVATVVGSGIMAETLAGGNIAVALLANTIATGAILFVLITALGPVSGAHLNPVVSTVFALRREISWGTALAFVAAQVGGGMCGTVLAHGMFEQPLVQLSGHARTGVAQWLSEAVATFALVLTILGTLRSRPDAVPVAVALVSGGVLVHRLHFIRQSGGHHRSLIFQHLRRNCPLERAPLCVGAVHRRPVSLDPFGAPIRVDADEARAAVAFRIAGRITADALNVCFGSKADIGPIERSAASAKPVS